MRKLDALHAAAKLEYLKAPPGNRIGRRSVKRQPVPAQYRRSRNTFAICGGGCPGNWNRNPCRRKPACTYASTLHNLAARKGVALSTPDALIAAQAFNRRASLFTTDGDFPKLAALAGLKLV